MIEAEKARQTWGTVSVLCHVWAAQPFFGTRASPVIAADRVRHLCAGLAFFGTQLRPRIGASYAKVSLHALLLYFSAALGVRYLFCQVCAGLAFFGTRYRPRTRARAGIASNYARIFWHIFAPQ